MEPAFWHARWEAGEIGFHQAEINTHLQRHWPEMHTAPGGTVLVPLCGKSRDMLWLAGEGQRVLGVEISPIAVRSFFAENGLSPAVRRDGPFNEHRSDEITLLEGDFFALDEQRLKAITSVYDRASLIALPPSQRAAYVEHLARLLAPGAQVLLITLDYPQHELDGPPFAVDGDEVARLWSPAFEVECLDSCDILEENPRFKARGLSRLQEQVYRLVRR